MANESKPSVQREAVATGTPDQRPVEVTVDPVVTYFLIYVTFPARARHIGKLRVYKKQSLFSKLWPKAKPLLDPTAEKIQKQHETTVPDKAEVSRTELSAEESGRLMRPEVVLSDLPCMNLDLNGGSSPDIQDKTLLRICTTAKDNNLNATFWYSNEPAYGCYPRLAFYNTEVRVHCGREWRQTHSTANLQNGHLIRDKDGEYTELTGTHGCIRVSWLWMKEIFDAALAPIATLNFTYSGYDASKGYEPSTAGTRRATAKGQAEKSTIGFMYAEQHTDANWCYAKEVDGGSVDLSKMSADQRVAILGKGQGETSSISICDSADWRDREKFKAFHEAQSAGTANIPIPRPRPQNL
jgi:hypothetical protein